MFSDTCAYIVLFERDFQDKKLLKVLNIFYYIFMHIHIERGKKNIL